MEKVPIQWHQWLVLVYWGKVKGEEIEKSRQQSPGQWEGGEGEKGGEGGPMLAEPKQGTRGGWAGFRGHYKGRLKDKEAQKE